MGYRTILVTCHERYLVRLMQVNLERGGYIVNCSSSAACTLEMIENERPDFLIIDSTGWELDGCALTRTIKNNPESASVPIMLLLPDASESVVKKALDSGADKYFVMSNNPIDFLKSLM